MASSNPAMTPEEMSEHVAELCAKHNVRNNIIADCNPGAYVPIRLIHTNPIESEIDYATALHELGHVVCCHAYFQTRAWKEVLAWTWAKTEARIWTLGLERFMDWCLHTHQSKMTVDIWPVSDTLLT